MNDVTQLTASLTGIGVWGPGFCSLDELTTRLSAPTDESLTTVVPKPAVIAARERRRSPMSVKLAIEVASQACDQAQLGVTEPACVFASGMGDTDITDYMCRTLAGADKLISPTRFHNSVHNAPAGYWTISTECQQAATSVAGFTHSFSVALLEAMVQVVTDSRPVLLVLDDVTTPAPMQDIHPINHSFAVALVLEQSATPARELAHLSLSLNSQQAIKGPLSWPQLATQQFSELYTSNPAARSLPLLEIVAGTATSNDTHEPGPALDYPLSDDSAFQLEVQVTHDNRTKRDNTSSITHAS